MPSSRFNRAIAFSLDIILALVGCGVVQYTSRLSYIHNLEKRYSRQMTVESIQQCYGETNHWWTRIMLYPIRKADMLYLSTNGIDKK